MEILFYLNWKTTECRLYASTIPLRITYLLFWSLLSEYIKYMYILILKEQQNGYCQSMKKVHGIKKQELKLPEWHWQGSPCLFTASETEI